MAYLPVKARSELVTPRKGGCGRVEETRRVFQSACSASHWPARRPTRGSRRIADALEAGAGAPPPIDEDDPHEARRNTPVAARSARPEVRRIGIIGSRRKGGRRCCGARGSGPG